MTLRGLECLQQADLVLYDGLVNASLLRNASGLCERTSRRLDDNRQVSQTAVNERLIHEARQGKNVVRLKGGDPFLFGRGGEEAIALEQAGIPYEVVPGATAAAAASGISLTHRGVASAVAFVTGHEDPAKSDPALDYSALAKFPGTLVFYMGWHRLPEIATALIAAGKPPETPAAVICRGTTPQQRTVSAPLAQIGTVARDAGLHPPSLIVIGPSVQLRSAMTWFESRPLFGLRIGILRAEEQADEIVTACWQLGADAVVLPLITIRPTDDWTAADRAISQLRDYAAVIFTSVNGVRNFLPRLKNVTTRGRRGDVRQFGDTLLAAIGPATARALSDFGLQADYIPAEYRAEALAEGLVSQLQPDQRVLWIRGSRARDVLPHQLTAAKITVDEAIVYHNEDVTTCPPLLADIRQRPNEAAADYGERRFDWLALSSPSIARSLSRWTTADALRDAGIQLAALSPVTAAAAHECGLPIAVTATEFTWPGLLQAIGKVRSPRRP